MVDIIPAILPDTFKEIETKTALVAGSVPWVQLDVCDGTFVNSRSWPYTSHGHWPIHNHHTGHAHVSPAANDPHFKKIVSQGEGLPHWQKLEYEIDLMVAHPTPALIDQWISAGAARALIHIESISPGEMSALIRHVREKNFELGLAIGVQTSSSILLSYLEDTTFVQFMGIERIGYQHQEFAGERVLDKIRAFHGSHPEIVISVDGGVTLENAKALVEAGASRLVCGSAVFGNHPTKSSVSGAIAEFRKVV
jgi:ribulose-phosphate 3-epimerase